MFRKRWFKPAVAGIITLIITGSSALGLSAGVFAGAARGVQDGLFPSAARDDRIAIVAVDDKSLASVGRWPWSRAVHARLLKAIEAAGVAAVVYDIQFSEPSQIAGQDAAFARAIAKGGNVILGSAAQLEGSEDGIPLIASLSDPVDVLKDAAAGIGLVNVATDPDGVVRRTPLLGADFDGGFISGLSLAALQNALDPGGSITVRPQGIQAAGRLIPTDDQRLLTLNFAGDEIPTYSAVDVLRGEPVSALRGKVVFIGATAGGLGDLFVTPVDKSRGTPGVVIHAEAVNTMLTAAYLTPSPRWLDVTIVFVLALAVAWLVLRLPVSISSASSLALGGVFTAFAFWKFDSGAPLNMVYPYVSIFMAFVAALSVKYFTELKLHRQVENLFGQYVPPQVSNDLTKGNVQAALEGHRAEVTVLFCDLRGFTEFSSKMPPVSVKDMLNIYYWHMSALVRRHEGTLLNYVGDEIIAIWGAPLARDDHAAAALACARSFHNEYDSVIRDLADAGLPPIAYGIGLNSGEVVAAHLGNELYRQYTVIGDTVNVGARLCSQAKAGEILLSEMVLAETGHHDDFEPVGVLPLKGVSRDIEVFRVPKDSALNATASQPASLSGA